MKYCILVLSLFIMSCEMEMEPWEYVSKYSIINSTAVELELKFYNGDWAKDSTVVLGAGDEFSWFEGIDTVTETTYETFEAFNCDSVHMVGDGIDILFWNFTYDEDDYISYFSSMNPIASMNYEPHVKEGTNQLISDKGVYGSLSQLKLDYEELKAISK